MRTIQKALALVALLLGFSVSAYAADAVKLSERVLGKPNAPLTLTEYASLTCSHCADFANTVLPELEKRYVDTGKVKIVYRDFPTDGVSLKAAALATCMPDDKYFPFIKILFKNFSTWTRAPKPESVLLQYAQFSGLTADKAQACLEDSKVFDALVARRTEVMEKYGIQATPSMVIGDGEEKIVGAQSIEVYAAAIDKALAKKK